MDTRLKIRVFRNNNITFLEKGTDGSDVCTGKGFITKENEIALTECPVCGQENYAMAVIDGQCAWCSFDARKLSFE